MKKITCICSAAILSACVLAGCSANSASGINGTSSLESANASDARAAKAVVNFEGTVTAVDGNEVTLENGKKLIISPDTVFAGDPDTNNSVSEEILVGNFVQGYTKDDPESDLISADKIWCNIAVVTNSGTGKIRVNIEGTIASVDGNSVTLDNGEVIFTDGDTVFSIAGGIVENVVLSEGYFIQGYAENSETAASRIHIAVF